MLQKYNISRVGRKLQNYDDSRMMAALPKHVPERIWAEVVQREERELTAIEMREVVLEEVDRVCSQRSVSAAAGAQLLRAAARSWAALLRLQWATGADAQHNRWCASPPPPAAAADAAAGVPLPHDGAAPQLTRDTPFAAVGSQPSHCHVSDIPQMYWFPGRVQFPGETTESVYTSSSQWEPESHWCHTPKSADSEVLQRVTDYGAGDVAPQMSSSCKCEPLVYNACETHTGSDSSRAKLPPLTNSLE